MTHLPKSSLGFPLPWKRSEDFGLSLAGCESCADGLDGVGVYHEASTIKPISDVGFSCDPFEVISSAVGSNLVLVVNNRQIEGIGNESLGHKAMDQEASGGPILRKFNLGITSSIGADFHQPPSNESCAGCSVFNDAVHAKDASEVAYAVKSFVSFDVSPFLARQQGKVFFFGLREKADDSSLQVKLVGLSSVRTEVGDQKAIIDASPEHSSLTVSSAARLAFKSSDAVAVRDFIEFLKPRNWAPNLSFLFRKKNRALRENLSGKTVHVDTSLDSVARQHCSILIQAEDHACAMSPRISDCLSSGEASNSSQIRDFVKSLISRDWAPLLNKVFHRLSPVVTISKDNSKVSRWLCQSFLGPLHLLQKYNMDQMVRMEVSQCPSL